MNGGTAVISLVSEERDALVESATRFIADRYPAAEHLRRLQSDSRFSRERWQEIAELGWLGTSVAEEDGGLGLKFSFLSDLAETLGSGVILEPFVSQVAFSGYILDSAASGDLRDDVLQRWLAGDTLVAFAHQESRSDHFFDTQAELFVEIRDSSYLLTGKKFVVIDGSSADYFIVSGRLKDHAESQSLFLIPAKSEGLSISSYRSFDGRDIVDIEFNDVAIPRSSHLEFETDTTVSIDTAKSLFGILIASESLGIVKAILAMTYRYLNEREQFGVKIASFQALQHRLTNLLLAATRVESLIGIARQQIDELGLAAARDSIAAANFRSTSVGAFIAQDAIQLHGATGMTDEFILGHYLKRLTANGFLTGNADEQLSRFTRLRGIGSSPGL